MLKLSHGEDERLGGVLMEWWDGDGAARVLAQDEAAILLERATGPASLADMARLGRDDEACRILCAAAARLHAPRAKPRPELIPLEAWFRDLEPAAVRHGGTLFRCAEAARALLAEPRDVGVLHGDLHHDNVLDFGARGWLAIDPNDIVETYGPHNTILDNCHVYTAFSALDPLTQDKVSKLTGSITETRTSRSGPAGLGGGRSSLSRSEVERPLLEPGEIRALPDHRQLVFVAGQRPLLTDKLLYDRREPFRSRAGATPPDQALGVDGPGRPPHPWLGRRSLGRDAGVSLPLFKEAVAAMDDRKAAARAADVYGRVAEEMAAQEAALDQLQGGSDA